MWQFITLEAGHDGSKPEPAPADLAPLHRRLPVRATRPRHLGTVTHGLTHRRYHFDVFTCDASGDEQPVEPPPRVWTTLPGLSRYPLPRPHLKIAEMLGRT